MINKAKSLVNTDKGRVALSEIKVQSPSKNAMKKLIKAYKDKRKELNG